MSSGQDFVQPPLPPPQPRSGGGGGVVAVVIVLGLLGVMGLVCCGGVGTFVWFVKRASPPMATATVASGSTMAVPTTVAESPYTPYSSTNVDQLAGVWRDTTTDARYTIEVSSGYPSLVSVVSASGESYAILSSNWDGSQLSWTYQIPSTSASVQEYAWLESTDVLAGNYTTTPLGGYPSSGSSRWEREGVRDAGPGGPGSYVGVDAFSGEWVSNGGVRYRIAVSFGQPQLEAVSSSDGVPYEVLESDWDGSRLRWRFRIADTGTVFEEWVRQDGYDHLSGDYTYTTLDGSSFNGTDAWTRAGAATTQPTLPADSTGLVGEWVNTDINAVYAIRATEGGPQLVSVVDSVGDVLRVDYSFWDAASSTLQATVYVPLTQYTMRHTLSRQDDYTLRVPTDSVDPQGSSSHFDIAFTRAAWDLSHPARSLLEGTWVSAVQGVRATVRLGVGGPTLDTITSFSGEYHTIESASFEQGVLRWRYRIAATGYVIEEQVCPTGRDTLASEYASIAPDGFRSTGSDTWNRQPTDAAAYEGAWKDNATGSVHQVQLVGGQPTVTSSVGSLGEIYEVQSSTWYGDSIGWSYRIPSTGTVISETGRLSDHDHMTGSYTWFDTAGNSGSGSSSWTRQSGGTPDTSEGVQNQLKT